MAELIPTNFEIPADTIMVLADADSDCIGTIIRCRVSLGYGYLAPPVTPKKIVFIKNQTQEVKVNDVDYLLMHVHAIVGVIPT